MKTLTYKHAATDEHTYGCPGSTHNYMLRDDKDDVDDDDAGELLHIWFEAGASQLVCRYLKPPAPPTFLLLRG